MPFALLAAVMAWGAVRYEAHGPPPGLMGPIRYVSKIDSFETFRLTQLVGVLLCMITARSFAMAFNRLADRHIDATNPRTAGRHLPAGILGVPQVTAFAVVCAAGFVASTMLFLPNRLPLFLSIPVLLLLA